MVVIRAPMPSTRVAFSITTTGMPTLRMWSSASGGPVSGSASTRVGCSERTDSAETSWARVTSGRWAASAKVAEMSRATTLSPSPSAKTTSEMLPTRGTIRLTSSTVTRRPSADVTVTGRTGVASAGVVTDPPEGSAPGAAEPSPPHAPAKAATTTNAASRTSPDRVTTDRQPASIRDGGSAGRTRHRGQRRPPRCRPGPARCQRRRSRRPAPTRARRRATWSRW